jgi:peptidyl-prolyl cis-trans isomerase A (cyclophilin A)
MILTILALLFFAAEPQTRPNGLYAIFNTSMGQITAKLYEKDTPIAVKTFVDLAQGAKATRDAKTGKMVYRRLYDNITFHRIVRDEMIQSGDPTGTGGHDCGFTIRDEILPGLRFEEAGKLAMANIGKPDTGGCQFFITVNSMRPWTGQYTIFGYVVQGMDVATKMNRVKLRGDRPIEPVKLISVTIERVGWEPVKKPKKK